MVVENIWSSDRLPLKNLTDSAAGQGVSTSSKSGTRPPQKRQQGRYTIEKQERGGNPDDDHL